MSNWWLAASSQQHTCSCITSHAKFFCETSNHPGDSAPLQPRFGALRLLAFPKTEITFEREEISDCRDSGKYDRAADGNQENCVRSQGTYFEGDWGVIVVRTMFLVSSSINVSVFHNTWLDTFWTDLVYLSLTGRLVKILNGPFIFWEIPLLWVLPLNLEVRSQILSLSCSYNSHVT